MKQPPIDDLSILRREDLTRTLAKTASHTRIRHAEANIAAKANGNNPPSTMAYAYNTIAETLNRITGHVEILAADTGITLDTNTQVALEILHHDLTSIAANFRAGSDRIYRATEQGRAAA